MIRVLIVVSKYYYCYSVFSTASYTLLVTITILFGYKMILKASERRSFRLKVAQNTQSSPYHYHASNKAIFDSARQLSDNLIKHKKYPLQLIIQFSIFLIFVVLVN